MVQWPSDSPSPGEYTPAAPLASRSAPRLIQPPSRDAYLADGLAAYLLRQEQEGAAKLTLDGSREAAWLILEFLGGDMPIRELSADCAARWLDWLRSTFSYRRKRGAYPAHITHSTVSAFYTWPPQKTSSQEYRSAATVSKHWRVGSAIMKWLKIPVEVERRKRRNYRRLPPIVPKLDAISTRWLDVLTTPGGSASVADRRQVVLTQGLILLWGTRLHEALAARLEDVEGHWVLVKGKTGMRLSYLNSQALGIVEALKGQTTMPWADERFQRVAGWPWSHHHWHDFVRQCAADIGRKPQQDLRKRFSTWVHTEDSEVEMLLAGHGGGVIFDHYLDTLERVPAVMERMTLPAVDGFRWPDPLYPHRPAGASVWGPAEEARAAARLCPPRRLYAVFDRWLAGQERDAAR